MKKTITFLILFLGLTSQAQYINHTRFEIEANAGYSISIGLNKFLDDNTSDVNFSSETSGFIIEAAAYYRAGFDSNNLFGLKINKVDGKSSGFDYSELPLTSGVVNKKSSLTFLGPSYRLERKSRTGRYTASVSFTPGIMLLETKIDELKISNNPMEIQNYSGTMKSTGLGINLAVSNGYAIVESLHATFNFGIDFSTFNKYKVDSSVGSYYDAYNPFEQRKDLLRINLALGLRYKL